MPELHPTDRTLLRFEETNEFAGPTKDTLIRAHLHTTPAAYYSRLLTLIRTQEALAEYPLLVHRLERRVRERVARREARLLKRGE